MVCERHGLLVPALWCSSSTPWRKSPLEVCLFICKAAEIKSSLQPPQTKWREIHTEPELDYARCMSLIRDVWLLCLLCSTCSCPLQWQNVSFLGVWPPLWSIHRQLFTVLLNNPQMWSIKQITSLSLKSSSGKTVTHRLLIEISNVAKNSRWMI